MKPVDYMIIGVVLIIAGLATWYIVRSKKKGQKCIGCPGGCGSSCSACTGQCGKK